jgi:hypothetical protein
MNSFGTIILDCVIVTKKKILQAQNRPSHLDDKEAITK